MARSLGHCGVMGTAPTMALFAEALGMALPGSGTVLAVDIRRGALAETAGECAVEMATSGGPRPSEILTRSAFGNAITTLMAVSGSTNALIHLMAIAGRVGVPPRLDEFDHASRQTPWLVDVRRARVSRTWLCVLPVRMPGLFRRGQAARSGRRWIRAPGRLPVSRRRSVLETAGAGGHRTTRRTPAPL